MVQDERIPARRILRLIPRRSATLGARSYAKNVPSLKRLFEIKIEELIAREEEKDKITPEIKAAIKKEEIEQMHRSIDKFIEADKRELEMHLGEGDTTQHWRKVSMAMGKGWPQYLEFGKDFDNRAKGRGELIEIKLTPKREGRTTEQEEKTRKRRSQQQSKCSIEAGTQIRTVGVPHHTHQQRGER